MWHAADLVTVEKLVGPAGAISAWMKIRDQERWRDVCVWASVQDIRRRILWAKGMCPPIGCRELELDPCQGTSTILTT